MASIYKWMLFLTLLSILKYGIKIFLVIKRVGAYIQDQLPNQASFSYLTKGAGLCNKNSARYYLMNLLIKSYVHNIKVV
ncbi:hypothetical protein A361_15320 [Cytobacillus oceanisediminis 2691]|uniref:Uncharacterized protein n=2 Tax=Cytobacillus oceanisediminis TaxID=665099 RepID=A0A160MC48_9BACI|nr:hypothetical protein A361_15320 [Cytobacillus oceanisediminis 2691]OHX44322.1 hypothetical protein BBV17_25795 [Cytobacillus oceanisediminis]